MKNDYKTQKDMGQIKMSQYIMEKTNYLSTDEIVGKDFISLFDNIKFKISNELLNMTFKEFIEYELSMIKILNKVDSNKNGFIIDLSTKTIEHYDIN